MQKRVSKGLTSMSVEFLVSSLIRYACMMIDNFLKVFQIIPGLQVHQPLECIYWEYCKSLLEKYPKIAAQVI